jgi:hypothetical protein
MKTLMTTLVALLALCGPVEAQDGRLARIFSGVPMDPGVSIHGDWVHITLRDEFTDAEGALVYTWDETFFANPTDYNMSTGARLSFGCDVGNNPGVVQIMVDHQKYFSGRDNQIAMRLRVDQNEVHITASELTAEHTASRFAGEESVTLLREAMAGDMLYVEVTDPLDMEQHRFRFSLVGLTGAVNRGACVRYAQGGQSG